MTTKKEPPKPQMLRCFTRHGLRAHYSRADSWSLGLGETLCGKDAVTLLSRSRFFRRRLAQASYCYVCETLEEKAK